MSSAADYQQQQQQREALEEETQRSSLEHFSLASGVPSASDGDSSAADCKQINMMQTDEEEEEEAAERGDAVVWPQAETAAMDNCEIGSALPAEKNSEDFDAVLLKHLEEASALLVPSAPPPSLRAIPTPARAASLGSSDDQQLLADHVAKSSAPLTIAEAEGAAADSGAASTTTPTMDDEGIPEAVEVAPSWFLPECLDWVARQVMGEAALAECRREGRTCSFCK